MLHLGLIGFGAVARLLVAGIAKGWCGEVEISAVLERRMEALDQHLVAGATLSRSPQDLLREPIDLVVEMASQDAVAELGEWVLAAGRDLLVMSVGALADDRLFRALEAAARDSGARLLIPSGAIGGLDAIAIAAAAPAGLDQVTLTTRKPAAALGPGAEQRDASPDAEPTLLFDGAAREAVRLYPANVNVAAALSLAGIGFDRTRVQLYLDPTVQRNTHEIVARGAFGELTLRAENLPSDNPRTSRLAALSVMKTIRQLQARVVVGA